MVFNGKLVWKLGLVKRAADEYLIQSVHRVQSRSDQCVMGNESKQRSDPKKERYFHIILSSVTRML